jgi:hypothetical protein
MYFQFILKIKSIFFVQNMYLMFRFYIYLFKYTQIINIFI